jgi:hypothetical protein
MLLHQFQISSVDGSGQYRTVLPTKKETSPYFVWEGVCKGDQQNTRVPTKRLALQVLATLVATSYLVVVTRRETEFHLTTQKLIMGPSRDQSETSTWVVVV